MEVNRVAIDVATETLITPKQYAKMRPEGRNGRPMNLATVYRHFNPGVRGIRLEHVKFGGNTYTSIEAVRRFAERLTDAWSGQTIPTSTPVRSAARRARDLAKADSEVDA